jgi:hypothetical protein
MDAMRYFALLDDETVVEIVGASSWCDAFDKEPANTVWCSRTTDCGA